MMSIRIFEKGLLHVWLVDQFGRQRKLGDPIAHLGGRIDWRWTAESCTLLGDEGVEVFLHFEEKDE
jgi:hypothetical protein